MSPLVLVAIFIVSALVGYKLISNVPTLLHTPLMSGMNALSGITVLGAIISAAFNFWRVDVGMTVSTGSQILIYLAILLAIINVAGGFAVTHRMLRMFKLKKGGDV